MAMLNDTNIFETRRPFLTGLAYRILGSYSEAEDAVQDTFIKWSQADRNEIVNPNGWLTTACTRRCLDMLSAARQSRTDYVGAWLPEPIQITSHETPESASELASSLSMAFLLLLERLTPKERAAYLLRDIFDRPYEEVAAALNVQEPACRKLVGRARINIGKGQIRSFVPEQRQEQLLAAFRLALTSGSIAQLTGLMAEDIELRADSGGKVPAPLKPLTGKEDVLAFIGTLGKYWKDYRWHPAELNGARGALLIQDNRIVAAVSLACDAEHRLSGIFIVRNPDKLVQLGEPAATLQ